MMKKRTQFDVFEASCADPSQDQLDLFMKMESIDFDTFKGASPTRNEELAHSFIAPVTEQAWKVGLVVWVPVAVPMTGEAWDLDYLGGSCLAAFKIEMYFAAAGGSLYLQHIGTQDGGDLADSGGAERFKLAPPPRILLVARPLSMLYYEAEAFLRCSGDRIIAGPGRLRLPVPAGGSVGDDSKQSSMYTVFDLNGRKHQVSVKSDAYDRMVQVRGLIREMVPERFLEFCGDLKFDAEDYYSRCQQLRDTDMPATDPNSSIRQMRDLQELRVCVDMAKFTAAVLGKWIRNDWGPISLLDFRRPGAPAFEANLDYPGKRSLREAVKHWGLFQRAFKGEAFADCTRPIASLFVGTVDYLARYHSLFLQAQLEVMIGCYYEEVGARQGDTSKKFPQQAICNQADCVALLALFVGDFVQTARKATGEHGAWEAAPHVVFYSQGSWFAGVKNKLTLTTNGTGLHAATVPDVVKGTRTCHKHGLCPWHLAGALHLVNGRNARYKCRDGSFQHVQLNKVSLTKVRELIKDPEFMEGVTSVKFKNELALAVGKNKGLFGK